MTRNDGNPTEEEGRTQMRYEILRVVERHSGISAICGLALLFLVIWIHFAVARTGLYRFADDTLVTSQDVTIHQSVGWGDQYVWRIQREINILYPVEMSEDASDFVAVHFSEKAFAGDTEVRGGEFDSRYESLPTSSDLCHCDGESE